MSRAAARRRRRRLRLQLRGPATAGAVARFKTAAARIPVISTVSVRRTSLARTTDSSTSTRLRRSRPCRTLHAAVGRWIAAKANARASTVAAKTSGSAWPTSARTPTPAATAGTRATGLRGRQRSSVVVRAFLSSTGALPSGSGARVSSHYELRVSFSAGQLGRISRRRSRSGSRMRRTSCSAPV